MMIQALPLGVVPTGTEPPRYITHACDFCKQRHLRCDGTQPCMQCLNRRVTCEYSKRNVKRGPKPKKQTQKPAPLDLPPLDNDASVPQHHVSEYSTPHPYHTPPNHLDSPPHGTFSVSAGDVGRLRYFGHREGRL